MTVDDKTHAKSLDPETSREYFFKELEIEFLIHELKDPMSIIETGARTLLEKQDRFGPLTPKQLKTINRITRNARKAREMLYGLLEIGRSESSSFACNDFTPVQVCYDVLVGCLDLKLPKIADTVRTYKHTSEAMDYLQTNGIHFEPAPAAECLKIYQDETKFRQIAGNLIKNALHFRNQRLDLKLDTVAENLVLEVIDDGPGIPESQQMIVFRRYTQAKECTPEGRNGHGLGLAGARILARCLGGDIQLSSRKKSGTVFRLTLPLRFTEQS